MKKYWERLYNGIIKENPTFVQMLGMCPTLAVTSTAINGLGMGIATLAVLTMSNMLISMLRNLISDKVRIPAYITIIASFVTVVSFVMQAYTPGLYESLGVFIPLIVVNCIILGRAESYAGKNKVLLSIFDGIGMGLGFTLGLTVIGMIRELLGAGTLFGIKVTADLFDPIRIFAMNPGAFFVLAFIIAFINGMTIKKAKKNGTKPNLRRIDGCEGCTNFACAGKKVSPEEAEKLMKECADKRVNAQAAEPVKKDSEDNKTNSSEKKDNDKQDDKSENKSENKPDNKSDEKNDEKADESKVSDKDSEMDDNDPEAKTDVLAVNDDKKKDDKDNAKSSTGKLKKDKERQV